MRKKHKKRISELLYSMKESHCVLTTTNSKNESISLLQNFQEAAISIGNEVETILSKNNNLVQILKDYCDDLFKLSQIEVIKQSDVDMLNKQIEKFKEQMNEILETYIIVFLPYKASMWDSLESIWKACMVDERCECHVIPIPYFEFDKKNNEWIYHFDGDLFPKNVPIVNFRNYSIENEMPDIAYVHNPYDDRNIVTTIHPNYYSRKIKTFVRKLVYVPYYITSGFVFSNHLNLPVYDNMDYMVVQSENVKEYFKKTNHYKKMLTFGSPKIDKVISSSLQPKYIPEEWQAKIKGKKTLMLNTSISTLLTDGELYLNKIRELFKIAKLFQDFRIIWRPHPLIQATIKSMRPQLKESFSKLKNYFESLNIGVIDKTADISNTIAISDGYIGEEGSSVINLFAVTGKPVFIMNNLIQESFSAEEKRLLHIRDIVVDEDKVWFTARLYNGLFKLDLESRKIEFMGRQENQPKWHNTYSYMDKLANLIYFTPIQATNPCVYNCETGRFDRLFKENSIENLRFHKIVTYQNKVFYLPMSGNEILEYNTESKQWKSHKDLIENNFMVSNKTWGCANNNNKLWISAEYTNNILEFDMKFGSHKIHQLGHSRNGYSGICISDGSIWLAEVGSGHICKWTIELKKVEKYSLPDEVEAWTSYDNRNIVYTELIDIGDFIVAIPGWSTHMLRIEKSTGNIITIANEFWKDVNLTHNGYNPKYLFSASFGKKLNDEQIITQRMWDGAIAIVNVRDDSYESFYPKLSEEEFDKFVGLDDGFEKIGNDRCYVKRENRFFTVESMIDDLITGKLEKVKDRQLNEMQTLAANMNGSCGTKIHSFMMETIKDRNE